jgi:hypothetical protein
MKNPLLTIAIIILMSCSAVLLADRPVLYQWEETFTDWNPCTEQENEVTIYHNWYEHWHRNNAVFMDKYTGETDDGYYLYDGKYHISGNFVNSQIEERIRDTWVSADGSSYRFHYMVVWVWDVGEARMEDIRYECLD